MADRGRRSSEERASARKARSSPYGGESSGHTGISGRFDEVDIEDAEGGSGKLGEVSVQYGKKGKIKDDDGELVRNKSVVTRGSKMAMSFKKSSKGDAKMDIDGDDAGGLKRTTSLLRSPSMLSGSKEPTNMTIKVTRALGNRIGIQLNARNRIANIDKGTPAEKAGLQVLDMVKSVNGKTTEGDTTGLITLVDPNATELTFVIERPKKSQHKAVIAADNEYEAKLAEEVKKTTAEPEKPALSKNTVATASTMSLAAAGFALKKAGQ